MDFNTLNIGLNEYWTPQKLGKHSNEIANQHGMLLLKNLKTSPEDFFKFLKTTTFTFKPFDVIPWSDVLVRSGLSGYLKDEYVDDALHVTTTRPAIGKGEFLFVSCFSNLGFAPGKGDIIDFNTHDKIEVKGVRATISGDGKRYKQMSNEVITTAMSVYDTSDTIEYFSREYAPRFEELINASNCDQEKLIKLLVRLQNVENDSQSQAVAQKFAKLYDPKKPNLFLIVGAMQLYLYMKEISYLLMVNEHGFKCFKRPDDARGYLDLFATKGDNSAGKKLKLGSWETSTYGMEISI